jgi:hypothetical protein
MNLKIALDKAIIEQALKARSKNFTLGEIIHRTEGLSLQELLIGMYRMGYAQAFCDYLALKFKKNIRLKVTSGWRSQAYNSTLPNASANSYHVWRFDDKNVIISANDFTSPDLSKEALHEEFAAFVRGETYLHRRLGFNHASDYGKDEDFTV